MHCLGARFAHRGGWRAARLRPRAASPLLRGGGTQGRCARSSPSRPALDTAARHSDEPNRLHGQRDAGSARPLEARAGARGQLRVRRRPPPARRARSAQLSGSTGGDRASGSVKERAPRSDAARASADRRASSRPSRVSASRATASAVTTCALG